MNTKRIIMGVALLLSVASLSLSPIPSFAKQIPMHDGDEIILIHQHSNDPGGGPRTLSNARIEASLDAELYVISVRLQNAGTSVTVDIENTTTGACYQYFVSGDGSDSLPISGASGYWTITFTLADGSIFYGTFIL